MPGPRPRPGVPQWLERFRQGGGAARHLRGPLADQVLRVLQVRPGPPVEGEHQLMDARDVRPGFPGAPPSPGGGGQSCVHRMEAQEGLGTVSGSMARVGSLVEGVAAEAGAGGATCLTWVLLWARAPVLAQEQSPTVVPLEVPEPGGEGSDDVESGTRIRREHQQRAVLAIFG